jgi:hypothetical protein
MHVNHLRAWAVSDRSSGTVRCYSCDSVGTVTGPSGSDAVADRDAWPTLACLFTAGCEGTVEPEALN